MAKDNLNQIQDKVNLEIQTARLSLSQALDQVQLSQQSLEKPMRMNVRLWNAIMKAKYPL